MEHLARVDHLTSLPNRLALHDSLQSIENYLEEIQGGLLFIDLDYFKTVNDSLGHDIGDKILIQVAERILAVVGERGFVARLGGDEFSVLLKVEKDSSHEEIETYLYEIADAIRESIVQTYFIGLHTIRLGVSIGIAQIGGEAKNLSDKLNEADIAMYEAKYSGRNRVLAFNDTMRKKIDRTHHLFSSLETACENDEFYLMIQPQYDGDRQWLGGEALLRWNNPVLGEIGPAEFIPACEQSGVIHQVGLMVFEKAFDLVSDWHDKYPGIDLKPLAVNVSARQFQNKAFIDDIRQLLDEKKIQPSLIQFELTESLLLENQDEALVKLQAMEQMGFSLAIDDFGTGYSSLNYISKLPINKLKIDQTFTQQITHCSRQSAIVETIITMAYNLDMSVIAEGVESMDQLKLLQGLGCNEFQGFLFARPMSVDDYVKATMAVQA